MITELAPAGAERIVYELATGLDAEKFAVEVVALRDGLVAQQLLDAGIPVHVIGLKGKLSVLNPLHFLRLRKILHRRNYDIIHTHLFHADIAARLAKPSDAKLIYSVHIAEKRYRPWQFWLGRMFKKRCKKIIAVSQAAADHHARRSKFPADYYRVIYNGINLEHFRRDGAAGVQIRKNIGIADGEMVLLFAGRLDHQKGVDILIDAFGQAAPKLEKCHLLIAGQGLQETMLRDKIQHSNLSDVVFMLGFCREIQQVMAAADILIMPSRWEGFGLSAAEAMAASLPVIATKVEGLSEVVVDGVTGLLVPPENSKLLADAIVQLVQDKGLREKFATEGHGRVVEKFTIDKMVTQHEQIYREVM